MKSRKYQLQKRPVYEQTDKRESERHKNEEDMRRQASKNVGNMGGVWVYYEILLNLLI